MADGSLGGVGTQRLFDSPGPILREENGTTPGPRSGPSAFFVLSACTSFTLGVVLIIIPWTPWWDANYLLHPYPTLQALIMSGPARGATTGLGIVNCILAVHELYAVLLK